MLFTDAVRVNLRTLRRESLVPARLLGFGLPLTIVVGALAGLALFPQLNIWTAAALATILAPTDAALGLPVVSNRRLPSRIRQGLNVESGLNDGVCVPLLVTWTVALSVYAHGLTAWPGANRYADWYTAHAKDHAVMPESASVEEGRIRGRALAERAP